MFMNFKTKISKPKNTSQLNFRKRMKVLYNLLPAILWLSSIFNVSAQSRCEILIKNIDVIDVEKIYRKFLTCFISPGFRSLPGQMLLIHTAIPDLACMMNWLY